MEAFAVVGLRFDQFDISECAGDDLDQTRPEVSSLRADLQMVREYVFVRKLI